MDQTGIMAKLTECIASRGGNILSGDVFVSRQKQVFYSWKSNYQSSEKNMAGVDSGNGRSLEQTPTWAVAVVCLAFVAISLLLEHGIHYASNWLLRRNKRALSEVLEKLKPELMLLGFISLLLTVGQKPISMICIPKKIAYIMLPCKKEIYSRDIKVEGDNDQEKERMQKILWESMSTEQEVPWRRVLDASKGSQHCSSAHGKYPLVSQSGMHQLHIFTFMLAVLHVLYSILTVALARAKMRHWKEWERESQTLDYEFSNDGISHEEGNI